MTHPPGTAYSGVTDRRKQEMNATLSSSANRHAVVIGGSLAGLLSARALAKHFSRVTVIERDSYPAQAVVRTGVPQAHHVHALLLRGLQIIESEFPRIREQFCRHDATLLDSAADFSWFTPAGWAPRFQSGLPFLAASRALVEHMVRCRVAAIPNVEFRENAAAVRLHASENRRKILGVYVQSRDAAAPLSLVTADLTIDASGRSSAAPEWLASFGYQRPPESVVDGYLGYASRIFRRQQWFPGNRQASFSQARPPQLCRMGFALPVEGERWMVTLGGGGRDYPPTGEKEFTEFARSLPNPNIYHVITTSEPLSAIRSYRTMQNRFRHYEKIRMPAGFLVVWRCGLRFQSCLRPGNVDGRYRLAVVVRCGVERTHT